MTSSRPSAFRKYCAAFLAATLALQPLGMYAAPLATSLQLSEIPLQGLNPVKPNIMYTMDDSVSMSLETLPDYVGGLFACRDSNALAVSCSRFLTDVTDPKAYPPLRSKDLNKIYYDPAITYAVGKRSDNSDLPLEGAAAGTWTSVYVDGFAGYPGANPGGTIDLNSGYPDEVFCWSIGPAPAPEASAADLATAKTDGSVCRYNGRAYPSVTVGGITSVAVAAGYNYPNATTLTCTNTATSKCVFGRHLISVFPFEVAYVLNGAPYYYNIVNGGVKFCQTAVNFPINLFGASSCTTRWFVGSPWVSYGAGGLDVSAFVRVDINPADAAQMANFAKWYAFNRTRVLAMKTAAGLAFSSGIVDNSRVGFNTLNTYLTRFLNVQDFTPAYKETWFTNFYAVVPVGQTPSIDAMWRIGQYFSNQDTTLGALPPLPGAVDPLAGPTGRCQSNYHLMSTDGFWNQNVNAYSTATGTLGNQDRTVPALPNLPGATGFTPGLDFPAPYHEGSTATSNTMADVAMYYWINDLRADLADKVQDATAPWQHVNFYPLALGAEGTLDYPTGIAGLTTWPVPLRLLAEAIDDLWHAAINSRGQYFNAQNAQQLAESVAAALDAFTRDQSGTGTAVGLAGAQLTATRSSGYRTSYEDGWSGDVKKYALDPTTGELPANAVPVWSAGPLLDAMAAGAGWDTNRRIVTINDSTGAAVPFRFANLSAAQQTSLNAGYTLAPIPTGDSVLNFLRGDKSNEGTASGNFRVRTHILGDIVSSGAVPVGAPGLPYDDAGNPGYIAFALAKQNRTPAVYAGSNDGMVHAFDDSATADAGKETWAYVPKALFTSGDPNDTAHPQLPKFQLGALSFRRGGLPLFEHVYRVNATPRVWDIDFANTNTNTPPRAGNDWRTLLVGGLGAGGRSVYALDVTTPVALTDTEATVAASGRALWEFTETNLGYVFDAPTLVKTKRYGWVVLVASGYNNPGGKGILYVLNPTNGALLQKMSTGIGSDTDPSGLSTIRAFTSSRKDPYVLQAYGGDLRGNVWRFDLSDPSEANWKVELIAKLTDASGNAQPITTGIRAEIDQNNNVDRLLFVGTGKLLNKDDINDTSVTNTLYVIRDGTRIAAEAAPATPYSRADLNAVDGTQIAGFAGLATGRGWYQDAPDANSKIISDVVADVQTVVWATSKAPADPCDGTLESTLYARDYLTGNSVLESAGGVVVPSISNIGSIAGVRLIQGQGGAGGATGDVRIQVTTTKGQVFSFGVKLTGAATLRHRVSWRLLSR